MNIYVAMVLSVLTCLVGLGMAICAVNLVYREKTRGVFVVLLAAIALVMLGGPLGAKLRTFTLKPGGLEFALGDAGLPDDKEDAVLTKSAQAFGAAMARPTSNDPREDTRARAVEYGRELVTYIQRCGFTPVPPAHAAIELGSIVRVAIDGSITVVARPRDLGLRVEPTQGPAPIATSIRTKSAAIDGFREVEWILSSPTVETASLVAMEEIVSKCTGITEDLFIVNALLLADELNMQEIQGSTGSMDDKDSKDESVQALIQVEGRFVLGIQLLRVAAAPAKE